MPKLSELRSASEIRAEDLADPEIAAEYSRTELAHAVAMRVLKYRTENGRSTSPPTPPDPTPSRPSTPVRHRRGRAR